MPCLLLVDDDGDSCVSLARALKAGGLDACIEAATSATSALAICRRKDPAVVVLDLSIDARRGVESGFELLRVLSAHYPHCRIILLTGNGGVEHGVRALTLGAASFLEKPAAIPHLLALIRDSITQSELRRMVAKRESETLQSVLVGSSPVMRSVQEGVRFAAQTSQPVFLSGETGTGKGICAQLIHKLGKRNTKNFVRYQPNFTSSDLVNSDLFGHRKGSFTGATEERRGLIAEAERGTLFLDEIDELPLETQVTLLGVLQERRYRPVGSTQETGSDFRLITASNRDLQLALEQGKIRRDFYHRIAHTVIRIPPLRERLEDLPELAAHILEKLCEREELHVFALADETFTQMKHYRWPGNVRELEAVIESGAWRAQCRGATTILPDDLPLLGNLSALHDIAGDFESQVEAFKLKLIEDALSRSGGNQVKAAEDLALDRSTLRRILKRSNARAV